MDPNSPQLPTQQPSGEQFDSSQFDFIMNSNQKPKKSLLPTGSPKQRIILFIALGLGALVILLVIFSLLFGGGNSNTEQMVSLAQKQNEIIRVATIGSSKAGTTETQKLANTTRLVVTTDQNNTIDWLAKQRKELKGKELLGLTNATTDADLTAAERNGRFDEVFARILIAELEAYQADMKTAYDSLGKSGKAILEQNNKNVTLILKDNRN